MPVRAHCLPFTEKGIFFIIGKHLFSNHMAMLLRLARFHFMIQFFFFHFSFFCLFTMWEYMAQKKNTIQNETDGMDPPSLHTNYIATVAIFTACTSRFPPQRKIVVSTRHPRFKSERIFWSLWSAHALHQLKHVHSTSFKLQQTRNMESNFPFEFFLIHFFKNPQSTLSFYPL